MSQMHYDEEDVRVHQALAELQTTILSHHPTATFMIGACGESPDSTCLTVRVDLDDPDVVLDLVIERVLEFQMEDGLPLHVVPIRTPTRISAKQSMCPPEPNP